MTECFKCGISGNKVALFKVISKEGIVKVCSKCMQKEKMPIMKDYNLSEVIDVGDVEEEVPKKKSVYERLMAMSGIKSKERISKEKEEFMEKQNEELRKLVEENVKTRVDNENQRRDDLVENFHWMIMRARRSKHFTRKELAKKIGEPELSIKLAEEGVIPIAANRLIYKLENYLQIKIKKKAFEEPLVELRERGEMDFNSIVTRDVTVSELKDIYSGEKSDEEVEKNIEKDEGVEDFTSGKRTPSREEIDRLLYGREFK